MSEDVGAQARFGGDDEPTEWVPVYWASAMEEAHVVRGVLESEDVPAMLKHESRAAFGGAALGGVQVLVPKPLEDRALEILSEQDGAKREEDG